MSTLPLDLRTDVVALPTPTAWPDVSVHDALLRRRSRRRFLSDPLTLEELSAILWAAFGINRPEGGGRTAPSAHDWQEIDLYAVMAEGAFRYEAQAHRLMLVKMEDLRALTGTQDFVATAPLELVYVCDFRRMHDLHDAAERVFFAGADTGFIAQNVYLHCAAAGFGTVVRGLIDRRSLAAALGLAPEQRIALAQTVGRPGAEA